MTDLINYSGLILTAVLAHLIAVVSPGPDFILCVQNSLTSTRKVGIATAVGFGAGICVHIAYCLAGIGALIASSILLFNTLKIAGGLYLMYIGFCSLMSKTGAPTSIETTQKTLTIFQAFRMGFFTNALNPKATLFFLSIYSVLITPSTPKVVIGFVSGIFVLDTILWFSIVATILTEARLRSIFERGQTALNRTCGILLMMLGLSITMSKK